MFLAFKAEEICHVSPLPGSSLLIPWERELQFLRRISSDLRGGRMCPVWVEQ